MTHIGGALTISSRPLAIQVGQLRLSIPVSTCSNEWIAGEVLRDEFIHAQSVDDAQTELDEAGEATTLFFARFLGFVADRVRATPEDTPEHVARLAVLLKAVSHFTITLLTDIDIHSLVASYEHEARKKVLSAFYVAHAILVKYNVEGTPKLATPSLLAEALSGRASVFALFGGQGINEVYFDELQTLFDTYRPFVESFLRATVDEVLQPLASTAQDTTFYEHGMNVISWLTGESPRPPVAYLASVPVSFPLIGLTQFTQYLVALACPAFRLRSCPHVSLDDASFIDNVQKALKWLFFAGLRGQQLFPILALEPSVVQESIEGGEGQPTPMLSIGGLLLKDLQPHISKTNKHLPENSQLNVSLHNGPRTFIVTGPPRALYGLVTNLRKIRAPNGVDQSKIEFSKRKPDKVIDEDLHGEELWTPEELQIPVYNTEDGSDLRTHTGSLTRSICDQIFTKPLHWPKATDLPECATHVVDFGAGGVSGIGPLTARNLDGRGVRVIVIGDKGKGDAEFYSVSGVRVEQSWTKKWIPSLVKTSDGKIHINTPFSRLLGKPPIMVAGMTPTTVKAGFVSAVLEAGYHVELAGGGHYSQAALRAKVAEIQTKISPGIGLTLNSLYINPRQFSFQLPLWQEMRREGLPIEGFCVAAGIPTTEKAAEIIDGLKSVGIRHVSFKPGSVDGIRQVVNIASANPDFAIILQWTGGRAGGHHSFEDFHQPILATYSSIRRHENIALVAGSGFGGSDDTWPYLSGDWSKEFGVEPMPFDGFLFASRVMVAKEAHTSPSVKDLIVAASGVGDSQWEGTYVKDTGGIITVRSELGEPIHKVNNRALKLWKEYDDTVFKLPREKRGTWLQERRAEVIKRLNADYFKPWFPAKKDGRVVEDLGDMTYEETVLRLVRLMYVAHEERWLDLSLRNLTGDWLRRVEERFAGVNGGGPKASILQSYSSLDKPSAFVSTFFEKYLVAKEQLLAHEDKSYFLNITQRSGQKPAPFIPILDNTFEVWFKKDSLWASEDIEAVFDQDPQRVAILQGPVAVRHSTKKDEPIKEMLDNVVSGLVANVLERYYDGDESKIPVIDYLGMAPTSTSPLSGVDVIRSDDEVNFTVSSAVPLTEDWLRFLAGSELNWWHASLTSEFVVQGTSYITNPLRRVLAPRHGQKLAVRMLDGQPHHISVYGAARSFGEHQRSAIPLQLQFKYEPSQAYAPIHEVVEGRNMRIKEFYWRLWFGDDEKLPELGVRDTFTGPEVTIAASDVEAFCAVVGNQQEKFKTTRTDEVKAPMDFAIVTGWQAIMKAIFPATINGDLLKLVHLSNGFKVVPGSKPLKAGDVCRAEAKVVAVVNGDSGKTVRVTGHVLCEGKPVIEVQSAFLYRGRFTDYENTFETIDEPDYTVELATDADVGVLLSKDWFEWSDEAQPLKAGTRLIFRLRSEVTYKDKVNYRSVAVAGDVFVRGHLGRLVKVAYVDFERDESQGNPVVSYLQRHGSAKSAPIPLASEYHLTSSSNPSLYHAPATNEPYSKRRNQTLCETVVAMGIPDRVHNYNVNFVGMVLPGDELTVRIKHTAMHDGNLLSASRQSTSAARKSSREQGMGMELYNSSPAARAVWDSADAHLISAYGFSIVEIVRENPKKKTIHFGGIKGQAIRERYMEMTYDTTDKDGNIKSLPLFADINVRTLQHTHYVPRRFRRSALKRLRSALRRIRWPLPRRILCLASVADILPNSSLVDVVFYRGLTMQRAVERDELSRSNYAMCAVNPGRVSKTFDDAALREVVDTISDLRDCLLEIVNFNVEGQQYVCAGELVALQALTNVLNYLKVEKVDITKLTEKFGLAKVKEMLKDIVNNCYDRALEKQKAEGYIILERGLATIPLGGIDVPFHSRYLWSGVMPFRAYLSKKIPAKLLDPSLLEGVYIPNLIATPFAVNKEYAELIYNRTSSPRLSKVLLELLSYQFASPVRWIETQDLFFQQYKFERFIEIGPSPTLTGMAVRTLKAKYETKDDSTSVEIYYQFEDEPEAASEAEAPAETATPAPVVAAPVVVTSSAPAAPAGPATSIEDVPIRAADILASIVSQKLKKQLSEIPMSKSIKDLSNGKSTLQNEIMGDLQGEFSSAPDKGEELPLEELGAALGSGHSGNLGKYSTGLVSRAIGGKMPGGFNISSAKAHLSKTWGLGPQRADAVLLFATTMEPAKRLGSESEGKAWLDAAAQVYAQRVGITLSTGAAGGAAGGSSGGAVMNSEEFLKFQAEQHEFAHQQINLYSRYLKRDPRLGEILYDKEKASSAQLQARLDSIGREHGDTYVDGIQPVFDALKARHFDSSWNWVRQDAILMFYDILFGRLTTVDREITARCIAIMNRADRDLIKFMEFMVNRCDPSKGETYATARKLGHELLENCRGVVGQPPLYKDVTFPTAPHTEITEKGEIVYSEVNRENVRKLEAYVEEMASADQISGSVNIQKIQDDVVKLWNVVKSQPEISEEQKNRIKALYDGVVRSLRKSPDSRSRPGAPRSRRSSSQFLRPQISGIASVSADKIPLLYLKRRVGTQWEYSSNLTGVYFDVLNEIATSGTTFKDKNALITGVGKGSIGVEILKGLLSGGAHVVVTTSRYSRSTVEYYQGIFQRFGSRGSALTVVPFNQGSKQDVEALVDYIYTTLGLDLDYIIPFAAVPENGREIDGLDDKSELAHRIMLVNLLRLLGAVKTKKASRQIVTRPTQVVLPLSPNHGLFGNDGLYSESKISLETLFNRWSSESWGEYSASSVLWTRGTGLMDQSNMIAQEVETHGVRTFSAKEMAFNILGLMHPILFSITQVEPVWGDLSGGFDRIADLADMTSRIRININQKAELRRAIARDNAAEFKVINGAEAERVLQTINITPRANFRFDFPELPEAQSLESLSQLRDVIDLDKVIVIAGFGEVGPWGSSRTRWEMEAKGRLTLEGCIEMAWMMGYIKHFDGRLKDGTLHVGWVDAKTGEPVDDKDVRGRYEKEIINHAGVRFFEPELFRGYDPKHKVFNSEVELIHDLEPLEVSDSDAEKFKKEHGDKCDIWAGEGGQWFVKLKKGARVFIPKAISYNRLVAGQLPNGWNATRYGIPEDIIARTDRVSVWSLVATAEALNHAGITDPYELYQYIHPSEVGTCLGSGMGGMHSLAQMFKERRDEKEVQSDIMQETFINTTAGWINLLLMSSSGPVKIPVGACATALQSMEIASDTILSGKAKVMIAGGFDDLCEEGSFEFGNMKATSNSETELAMGREPTEMSRPTTTTRAGFMESQGVGVHIVMSAKTALELGCPIRGVLAFTSTSTDKAGRSIPAPGRGALGISREVQSKHPSPILDIGYRSRQISFRRRQIGDWLAFEQEQLKEEVEVRKSKGEAVEPDFFASRIADLEAEAYRQEKDVLATYGMLMQSSEGADPRIAPLRRALAVWGLTADDIGVLSIHGTSTQANEKNETYMWNTILKTLDRTAGNAVPIMAQKSLVGHSKGGAAAWQMAGLLQSIASGVVPGNRNADNVDAIFQQHSLLMFPSKTLQTDGITAGVMSSFGFGQVGGTALVVHPRYVLASAPPSLYQSYKIRHKERNQKSYKAMSEMMTANALVKIKEAPPYSIEIETPVLLNSLARASPDKKNGSYTFKEKQPTEVKPDIANVKAIEETLKLSGSTAGVGVDQELITSVPSENPTFISRNFTDAEIAYCRAQPSFQASFAARWVGKEAVFKSLGVSSKGAGAAMKDIEILPNEVGAPEVTLHGDAKAAAAAKGISKICLSLSHSDTVAIAFAQASIA
ncbi:fatty acid synthase [Lactarius quietus]|nr:fatty acid synthase [Lactarius quietus]